MTYTCTFSSPLGEILLASDGENLTGLWFYNQKYFAANLSKTPTEKSLPVFSCAIKWLDIYFSGKCPGFTLPLSLSGSEFQKAVWQELLSIPYGKLTTYGTIAKKIAAKTGKNVSAQAVGGAVGKNPVSIIIPCHRVIGASGSLTGYAGGIDKKASLLKLEGSYSESFTSPR